MHASIAGKSEPAGIAVSVLATFLIASLAGMQALLFLFLGKPAIAAMLLAATAVLGGLVFFIGSPTGKVAWRTMLACIGMAFIHPATNELLQLNAEPEASFLQVLSIFGDRLPASGFCRQF